LPPTKTHKKSTIQIYAKQQSASVF